MFENKYDFSIIFDELENDLEFKIEETIMQFTGLIVKAMQKKNIKTKKQLAELLKISPAAVTNLLSGNENISLKRMVEIANKLDFEVKIVTKELFDKYENIHQNYLKIEKI